MGKFQLFLSLSLCLSLLLAAARAMEFDGSDLESDERLWDLYERWRSYHTISRDLAQKKKRFNVFKDNVKFIHDFNKEELPYKLRLNRFGDMTNQEFRRSYGSSRVEHFRALKGPRRHDQPFIYEKALDLPHSIDWRKKGAVSYVKDQGQCGSCWAFSTVVAVEGINAIKTGKLVALSEQELVDCDKGENDGCNGGLMEDAFEYIKKTNGITTEDAYPYRAGEGPCIIKKNAPVVVIDGYQSVPVNNEKALKKAVAHQPVSVAMDASGRHFQFYSEGVFNGKCGSELDHGVAIVGYGTTLDGTKYWIVKNSWGPEWGEKGYLRMKREVPQKEGLCGIAREASYPIKTSPNPNVTTASPSKEEL